MNREQLCWPCHGLSTTLCSKMLWECSGVRAWAAPKNGTADIPTPGWGQECFSFGTQDSQAQYIILFFLQFCPVWPPWAVPEMIVAADPAPVTVPSHAAAVSTSTCMGFMDLSQAEIPQPQTYKLQGPFCPILISGCQNISESIRSHNYLRETGCQTCSRGYSPKSSFCWFIPYWHCWLPVNAWPGNINYC